MKKARALSPTYAFVLYTFCDPPPSPRARASPSLPLSQPCVVCAIANPLYQLSKELRPKVFLAVTIIYRSVSIKSPAPSFCALSVSSLHWFRRACCLSMALLYAAISGIHLWFSLKNIICSTLKAPMFDRMLPMSRARATEVSLSLAARGLDPVVKACEECEMRHSRFLDNPACRLRKLRGAPSPPKPRQEKSVLFQLHPFCYIPRQVLENADLVRDAWPRAALRLISSGTRTPSGSQ